MGLEGATASFSLLFRDFISKKACFSIFTKNEATADATGVCDTESVSILNPPDRISGAQANAPFDVMQQQEAPVQPLYLCAGKALQVDQSRPVVGIKATIARLLPRFSSLHQLLIWKSPGWLRPPMAPDMAAVFHLESAAPAAGVEALRLSSAAATSHTRPEHTRRHTHSGAVPTAALPYFLLLLLLSSLIRARAFKAQPRQMGSTV